MKNICIIAQKLSICAANIRKYLIWHSEGVIIQTNIGSANTSFKLNKEYYILDI